tara:strand:+ start:168667 stop:170172 length:1506 start_codon:yes stop_codon:yes gene_type:complete
MKTLNKLLVIMLATVFTVTACDDNAANQDEMTMPEIIVSDQGTMNGNMVTISNVTATQDGWIVIHRSANSGSGPMVPDIIGKAMVNEGENQNVTIQLTEGVSNDETLWAMLHIDDGTIGEYEFNGENGLDTPETFGQDIVMESFMIMQTDPMVMANDQINKGGIFTVDVNAAEDGWIVIHASNATNDGPQVPEIIGKAPVMAGMNEDVQVMLNEGETTQAGDILYPMLHFDTGTIGEYEFDGNNGFDGPALSGSDIVLASFTVQENTSTLTANNQDVDNNSITVDVESDTDGWVVVHKSNATNDGPMVPEIIGKAAISTGMNNDVTIMFEDSVALEDGETIWPMVHYDTGIMGEYEFDGVSGYDNPVIVDGNILMTSIVVGGSIQPSVTAADQTVENNMVTIEDVNTQQTGFVVLHMDNGEDAPVVPASIGHASVQLGTTDGLQIMLDDGVSLSSGDKVWAMLHTDTGTIGSYEFDGSADSNDPPVFDVFDNIVMVQFTIQ